MANDSPSKVVYEGEVLHVELDLDRLDELEEQLASFVELDEGEELVVKNGPGDSLEVQKLRKRD